MSFRHHLIIFLLVSCFVACTQEHDALDTIRVPATFTPSIGAVTENHTRVIDNTWTGNETIGIGSFTAGGSVPNSDIYKKYKPQGSVNGTRVQLTPTAEDQTIYYPTDNSEVNFVAFAPYKTPSSGSYVNYDLSDQSDGTENIDFIYYRGDMGYSQSNPVVALNFEHKLSRIVVNMTQGSGYATSLENAKTVISPTPTRASCWLTTGVADFSYTTMGDITPYQILNSSEKVIFEALVLPHGLHEYSEFLFTIDGMIYTYKIKDDVEPGKSYIYNFEMTPTGIILAGSTVSPWIQTLGNVAWSGDYYLSVSETTVKVYKDGGSGTLTIKTNYGTSANNLTISASTSESSIVSGTGLSIGNTTGSNGTYTLNYTLTSTATSRTRYIHVQAGTQMKVVVKVDQLNISEPFEVDIDKLIIGEDANCHIVSPGEGILFPISRAARYTDEYDSTHPKLSENESFTAEVLWQQNNVIARCKPVGNGPNARLVVQTNEGNEGNAVVCIKKGGTILWSWHIWVKNSVSYNSYVHGDKMLRVMSYDLGSTRTSPSGAGMAGLYYQWRRKDPFNPMNLYETGWYGTERNGSDNVTYSVQHPAELLYSSSTPYSWHYNDYNDTLYDWSDINNPCPYGWQVMTQEVASRIAGMNIQNYQTSSGSTYPDLVTVNGLPLNLGSNGLSHIYISGRYPLVLMSDTNIGILWVDYGFSHMGIDVGYNLYVSRTENTIDGSYYYVSTSFLSNVSSYNKSAAHRVRCIKIE